jgi:hypothetical protein
MDSTVRAAQVAELAREELILGPVVDSTVRVGT